MKKYIYIVVALFFSFVYTAYPADKVILKSGDELTGKIVAKNDNAISFEIHFDSITVLSVIDSKDILSIEADNEDIVDESTLFAIQQQGRGLVLYKGRWLPKKHVEMLINRQAELDKVKKITMFSIQLFICLMVCFAIVLGLDFFNYEWKKYRVRRISKKQRMDNRLHRRITLELPVSVKLDDDSVFDTKTTNISLGGVLLLTDKEYNIGTQLQLTIQINAGNSIQIQGVVVRAERDAKTQKNKIGISFVGMSSDKRQQIARLIAQSRLEKIQDDAKK